MEISTFGNLEVIRKTDGKNSRTIAFRTSCGCTATEHSITVDVHGNFNIYDLTFWANCNWYDKTPYPEDNFFEKIKAKILSLKNRISSAIKLLVTGNLEVQVDFVFRDDEHVNEYLKGLTECVDWVKEERKNEEI